MRLVLAVLLLVMAAGQLSDMGGFADVLDGYRLVPEPLLTPLAWSLAASEVMAGLGPVSSRRWGANLAVVVAVAWSVLAIVTFARDVPVDNCGCFGVHLGQPLRWWVLAQDASFVASPLLVRRAIRPPRVGAGGDGARSRDVSALR